MRRHRDDERPSGEDLARDEAEARAWRREQLAQRTRYLNGWAHILPSAPASTGSDTPPKDGDPRATPRDVSFRAPATDPSCAAETPAGAPWARRAPAATLAPPTGAQPTARTASVGQHPADSARAFLPSTPVPVGNIPAAGASSPAPAAGNSARTR